MTSKKELKEMYWDKGMTQKEIGKKIEVLRRKVSTIMKKYDINTRGRSGEKLTVGKFNKDLKKWCKDDFLIQVVEGQKIKDSETKVKLKCSNCDNSFWENRENIRQYVRRNDEYKCPYCQQKQTRWNYNLVKEYFKKQGCELLADEYINYKKPLKYRCECGNVSYISLSNFRIGQRCKKCGIERRAAKKKYSYEEVKKVFEKHGAKLLSKKYIHYEKKLKFKCKCGHISHKSFYNFRRFPRCNNCVDNSKGETLIKVWLEKNNLKYSREYTFDDLKSEKNKYYKFDFALFDNDKLYYLIEYDGRQHYEVRPDNYFGGKERLKKQKENDKIKNNYCIKNNISLLRIPYWKRDNINEVLNKVFNLKR